MHRMRAGGPHPCPRPRPSPERQLSRRPAPSPPPRRGNLHPAAATCTPPLRPAPRRCDLHPAAAPEQVAINAWLGPRGTASPLHFDRVHNLLAQVVGSKYVRLYAPSHSERLYPHPDGPHMNSSQVVDPEDYDHARFPRFAGTPYVDLVLGAGEMLYIPPRWWHFVESRETSFSVSFWWGREYAFGPEEIPP